MNDPNPVEINIKHALEKSGFPQKAVKLPFKPIYQSCKQYDTSLTTVLDNLKAQNIQGVFEGDFIVFRPPGYTASAPSPTEGETANALDPAMLEAAAKMAGLDSLSTGDMQKALDALTPEQREDLQRQVGSMSAEDKQNLLQSLSQIFNSNHS